MAPRQETQVDKRVAKRHLNASEFYYESTISIPLAAHCDVDLLKRLYDLRVVLASEIQRKAVVSDYPRQLGHGVF